MAKSAIRCWIIVALRYDFIILSFENALSALALVAGMFKNTCYSFFKFGKTLQSLDLRRNLKTYFAFLHWDIFSLILKTLLFFSAQ